jgi:hypothetical protein
MKISFEIDEQKYRQAICMGWSQRFGENLQPEELKLVPNPTDVLCALSVLAEAEIENVQYER